MSIAVRTENHTEIISLDDCVDVSCAAELKNTLLKAVQNNPELHIDVSRLEKLDVTAFQLLWAARCEAVRSGGGMHIEGTCSTEIESGLRLVDLSICQLSTSIE